MAAISGLTVKGASGSVDAGVVRAQQFVGSVITASSAVITNSLSVNNVTVVQADGTVDWSRISGRPSTFAPS